MLQLKDAEWLILLRNKIQTICCLQETYLTSNDTYRLKMKWWKMTYQASKNQKQAGFGFQQSIFQANIS
jgi:hypothetical protein